MMEAAGRWLRAAASLTASPGRSLAMQRSPLVRVNVRVRVRVRVRVKVRVRVRGRVRVRVRSGLQAWFRFGSWQDAQGQSSWQLLCSKRTTAQ